MLNKYWEITKGSLIELMLVTFYVGDKIEILVSDLSHWKIQKSY